MLTSFYEIELLIVVLLHMCYQTLIERELQYFTVKMSIIYALISYLKLTRCILKQQCERLHHYTTYLSQRLILLYSFIVVVVKSCVIDIHLQVTLALFDT